MSSKLTEHPGYDEMKTKLHANRREYELARFDHCKVLNSVINRYRYDLILSLCACFSGFETFFHVVFHQSIQIGVAQKQALEDVNDTKLKQARNKLEDKLSSNDETNHRQLYDLLEDLVQQQQQQQD
ncbi:hypothetical protein RFI_24512, partial [Reticulomyxa filosa]